MADEGKMETQNRFPESKVSHMLRSSDTRMIRRLVHQVNNHPNKDTLIADLQSNHPCNPYSEESVECFELCEISPKIQCS